MNRRLILLIIIGEVFLISSAFSQSSDWEFLGPNIIPANVNGGGAVGIGRPTCVRFQPGFNGVSNNIIYVGSPYGGLWKSFDGGTNWQNWHTDNLPNIGISDIAIDPVNPQIMYVATGDPDGAFEPNNPKFNAKGQSAGVFKSTDGGMTWSSGPIGTWFDSNGFPQSGF